MMRYLLILMAGLGLLSTIAGRSGSHGSSPGRFEKLANVPGAASTTSNQPASESPAAEVGSIELQRNPDGHFYADVEINGTLVHMLVDTGASGVALSREDARSAGIATSIGMPEVVGEGADGAIHGEAVRIERMHLGSASAEDVNAVVLNSGGMSLLGQDFLQRFSAVEIRGDRMVLR